jgi:exoribonuclease-2
MNDQINEAKLDERARQAMRDNGFVAVFPQEVLDQVKALKENRQTQTNGSIQDLRNLLWSSIDNESSRDLDQIEYAEQLDNGDMRILVGIADVDALVPKDSPIDKFAAQNTVTVYTESEIFAMLPEDLSTGLTSLNENQDRLAIIVELVVKENGDVPGNNVYRGLVRNHAKLAYESVGAWLDENAPMPEKIANSPDLKAQILLQQKAADRLHEFRKAKGALEFESIESSAVVVNGQIRDIKSVEPNSARKIIENFMVAANVEMAEFLDNHNSLSLRRVVKTPERWDRIREVAADLGEDLPEQPDAQALAGFLDKRRAADPEHFPDLSLSIVKLIGAGEYVVQRPGEDGDGHFGLGVRDYAHSTAPNRRYPDMVVQRRVKAEIVGETAPYSEVELNAISEQCNEQERAARKVERKMRKIVAATVMQNRVGQDFEAIVTGKTASGTFARILRPPVDGRIVKGEEDVRVGQKIEVKLLSADPRNGFIDFAAL